MEWGFGDVCEFLVGVLLSILGADSARIFRASFLVVCEASKFKITDWNYDAQLIGCHPTLVRNSLVTDENTLPCGRYCERSQLSLTII